MDRPVRKGGSEKFWAFIALLVCIMLMGSLSFFMGLPISGALSEEGMQANLALLNAKIRILDAAVVGLIGIAGMAAQSLFRKSQAEEDMAEGVRNLSQKTPPVTGEAREVMEEAKAEDKASSTQKEGDPWNR